MSELLDQSHPDNTIRPPEEMHRFALGRVFDPQQVARDVNRHAMDMVVSANEIGRNLVWAKDELPHGRFGNWLDDNCAFNSRTAQRYMKLALCCERHPKLLAPLSRGSLKKALLVTQLSDEELETLSAGGTVADIGMDELGDKTYTELQEALKKEQHERGAAADRATAAERVAEREKKNVERLTRTLAERDGHILPERQEEIQQTLKNWKSQFDGLMAQMVPGMIGLAGQWEDLPPKLRAELNATWQYMETLLLVQRERFAVLNGESAMAHGDLVRMEEDGMPAGKTAPPSISVGG